MKDIHKKVRTRETIENDKEIKEYVEMLRSHRWVKIIMTKMALDSDDHVERHSCDVDEGDKLICCRDKQFKDDLAKMKEELGRRQEAKAEASSAAVVES